ncbi:hypothetical protein TEA_016589 [Camellia sinensis var. sinensis]|uniref:Uncharacterized protein n=1 Tax=Camellia sinensis var. sinensis TaxID=542762 RepID=A0A4V3WML0_CAMSN|nr:hypothetical protein TEA_016589 [Camellia sinensis var. sinensis]
MDHRGTIISSWGYMAGNGLQRKSNHKEAIFFYSIFRTSSGGKGMFGGAQMVFTTSNYVSQYSYRLSNAGNHHYNAGNFQNMRHSTDNLYPWEHYYSISSLYPWVHMIEYIKGCVLFYKRESCSSVDSEEFEPEALVDSGVAHRKDNSEVKTGWKRHIEVGSIRRGFASKYVHCHTNQYGECSQHPFIYIAQKKTSKRKRDEYLVKEESPHANTSSNVDMRRVNYKSNMTGLVKLMKSTKFIQAQLGCLRETPFWHLLDALRNGEINLDECMKYDDVVVHVLQMYKVLKDAFYIGEKKMDIHDIDIKLFFGANCDTKPMDISYGVKPKTGIINKRCKNVSRLTSKWIHTLLTEALKGKKKYDNKEVTRLVCIYTCQKHFFSTSGKTIGWGYYAHMVPLESMQEYDWLKQIRTTLTSSISQNDKKLVKVIGCVMLLMVNAGELFVTPTEFQKFRCTTLKVAPKCHKPATTSPDLSNIKEEQHSGSNSKFFGDGVDLHDSNKDLHIPFSSPPDERAIVIASTSQPDIIDMLVKENQKA